MKSRAAVAWEGSGFGGVKGRTELPGYVDRYMNDEIELDKMVTHSMPLEDINQSHLGYNSAIERCSSIEKTKGKIRCLTEQELQ